MDAFDNYQRSERWFRLVSLIDYAGRQLCKEVLYSKESFSRDGRQLYVELEPYKEKMQYREQKLILCPSNGITDESKFALTLYAKLLEVLFKAKYRPMFTNLRKCRDDLFHMGNKEMSELDFEIKWNDTCKMLKSHGVTESVKDLKNGNLPAEEELRKIVADFESQIQGRV